MVRLRVCLLWHQHQPLYRSPRSGRYALPWVRLHGVKDYYDMAALAGEFPRLRVTFNLVPSLLDQIDDYVEGRAADPALDLARRPAGDLTEEDQLVLLDLFFSVPYKTLIAPFPRYAALYHKRGDRGPDGDHREALSRFKPRDLLDLQVWFHLAWCGPTLRARPEVRDLMRKGESFTEKEKNDLLDVQASFLSGIAPIHRRLQDEGAAELSTSPYYHPILPLLCDPASAREALPDLSLPRIPFRHPADARHQVNTALESMARRFGRRPTGVWPSEGALSETALRILGECGVRWTASDENVLRASLDGPAGRAEILRPHRVEEAGSGSPAVFFRDTALSDLVGFTYATWPPDRAADDFLGRLRALGREAPGGVVSVILDGENAWERFPDNGVGFLRALYGGLSREDDLETVTFSEALATAGPPASLRRLRAGSWIGANLATWIGHPEKNTAWEMLAAARREADQRLGPDPWQAPAMTALAAAEGSDWFWWFGDDHSSEQDAIFDASFRELLASVYMMLGAPAPAELEKPIKRVRARGWLAPTGPVAPVLDGRVSDYFEWLGAGLIEAGSGQGAMHRATGLIRRVLFGSDGSRLFFRVDPEHGDARSLLSCLPSCRLVLELDGTAPRRVALRLEGGAIVPVEGGTARLAAGPVLEIEVALQDPSWCELSISLESAGAVLQRLPALGSAAFVPSAPPDWSV